MELQDLHFTFYNNRQQQQEDCSIAILKQTWAFVYINFIMTKYKFQLSPSVYFTVLLQYITYFVLFLLHKITTISIILLIKSSVIIIL